MKKNNTMIVLTDEIKAIAKKNASLFGGNLSAYLTHLILLAEMNKQTPSIQYSNDNGGVQITAPIETKITNKIRK